MLQSFIIQNCSSEAGHDVGSGSSWRGEQDVLFFPNSGRIHLYLDFGDRYSSLGTSAEGRRLHVREAIAPPQDDRLPEAKRDVLCYLAIRQASSTTAAPAAAAMTDVTTPPPSASNTAM
jgi:hypothetical protein